MEHNRPVEKTDFFPFYGSRDPPGFGDFFNLIGSDLIKPGFEDRKTPFGSPVGGIAQPLFMLSVEVVIAQPQRRINTHFVDVEPSLRQELGQGSSDLTK